MNFRRPKVSAINFFIPRPEFGVVFFCMSDQLVLQSSTPNISAPTHLIQHLFPVFTSQIPRVKLHEDYNPEGNVA